MPMPLLTIAQLTLRESSRRRLVLAVVLLTIVLALFTGWGFHKLVTLPCSGDGSTCSPTVLRIGEASILILLVFMFSFVLALASAFVAAPAIAGDVESGVLLAILPRPIRRSDVLLGKWLGLSILVTVYAALAGAAELIIVEIATGYVPPSPVLVIAFVAAEGIVVLTVTLLGSTRLPTLAVGISVVVLFGLTWMAGVAGGIGAAFHNSAVQNVGTVSSLLLPTDGLWRGALYNLEPAVLVAARSGAREASANPFLTNAAPTPAYLIWVVCWVVVMLGLAVWSFNRREL